MASLFPKLVTPPADITLIVKTLQGMRSAEELARNKPAAAVLGQIVTLLSHLGANAKPAAKKAAKPDLAKRVKGEAVSGSADGHSFEAVIGKVGGKPVVSRIMVWKGEAKPENLAAYFYKGAMLKGEVDPLSALLAEFGKKYPQLSAPLSKQGEEEDAEPAAEEETETPEEEAQEPKESASDGDTIHAVIFALAEMLATAGDPLAGQVLAAYDPGEGEEPAEEEASEAPEEEAAELEGQDDEAAEGELEEEPKKAARATMRKASALPVEEINATLDDHGIKHRGGVRGITVFGDGLTEKDVKNALWSIRAKLGSDVRLSWRGDSGEIVVSDSPSSGSPIQRSASAGMQKSDRCQCPGCIEHSGKCTQKAMELVYQGDDPEERGVPMCRYCTVVAQKDNPSVNTLPFDKATRPGMRKGLIDGGHAAAKALIDATSSIARAQSQISGEEMPPEINQNLETARTAIQAARTAILAQVDARKGARPQTRKGADMKSSILRGTVRMAKAQAIAKTIKVKLTKEIDDEGGETGVVLRVGTVVEVKRGKPGGELMVRVPDSDDVLPIQPDEYEVVKAARAPMSKLLDSDILGRVVDALDKQGLEHDVVGGAGKMRVVGASIAQATNAIPKEDRDKFKVTRDGSDAIIDWSANKAARPAMRKAEGRLLNESELGTVRRVLRDNGLGVLRAKPRDTHQGNAIDVKGVPDDPKAVANAVIDALGGKAAATFYPAAMGNKGGSTLLVAVITEDDSVEEGKAAKPRMKKDATYYEEGEYEAEQANEKKIERGTLTITHSGHGSMIYGTNLNGDEVFLAQAGDGGDEDYMADESYDPNEEAETLAEAYGFELVDAKAARARMKKVMDEREVRYKMEQFINDNPDLDGKPKEIVAGFMAKYPDEDWSAEDKAWLLRMARGISTKAARPVTRKAAQSARRPIKKADDEGEDDEETDDPLEGGKDSSEIAEELRGEQADEEMGSAQYGSGWHGLYRGSDDDERAFILHEDSDGNFDYDVYDTTEEAEAAWKELGDDEDTDAANYLEEAEARDIMESALKRHKNYDADGLVQAYIDATEGYTGGPKTEAKLKQIAEEVLGGPDEGVDDVEAAARIGSLRKAAATEPNPAARQAYEAEIARLEDGVAVQKSGGPDVRVRKFSGFSVGDDVIHKSFGKGRVMALETGQAGKQVSVIFSDPDKGNILGPINIDPNKLKRGK